MDNLEIKKFMDEVLSDIKKLVRENNFLKNKLEGEERRHLDSEAKYHAAVLSVCREIERQIPGIDLDMVRFELET
jgi:hypothetical protein